MTELDEKQRKKLLKKLAEGCSRRQACKGAGFSSATLYRAMRDDPELKKEIEEAEEESIDEVESVLWETATSGNVTAIIYLLQNRRPDKWQDRRNQFTPPTESKPDQEAAVRDAFNQLSAEARAALEEADRAQLEDAYRREVRGDGEQRAVEAGPAPDADRPAD